MQNVLQKLLHVCITCALLSSTPRPAQSSQTIQLSCSQASCIFIPVVHITPYLTSGYWRPANGYFGEYIIYGEVENNSPFPIDNIVLKSGIYQFTTASNVVLPGTLARYVAIFPLHVPEPFPARPTIYSWTVNTTTQFQPLEVLAITTREQQDEFGGYTAVTVTLSNGSPIMLRGVDVQIWAYQFFDENLCRDCFETYTRTSMLTNEVVTITDRWRFLANVPPAKTHPERIRVSAHGVISP